MKEQVSSTEEVKTKPSTLRNNERFKSALLGRKRIIRKINEIEREIFRYETLYLEMTQGMPLTKGIEYYICNKTEKKKYVVDDKERIFSRNFPAFKK